VVAGRLLRCGEAAEARCRRRAARRCLRLGQGAPRLSWAHLRPRVAARDAAGANGQWIWPRQSSSDGAV